VVTLGERPDTVIGRRLAERALAVAASVSRDNLPGAVAVDLITPEAEEAPAHVRAAAKDALDRGETHYTSGPGILALRRAVAARSTAEGFPADAEGIVVTNGGSEAWYIALQSVLRSGDRVLVAGPVAPGIIQMIEFVGAIPVFLPVRRVERFIADPDSISSANPAPRAVLLSSPSPVTGVTIPDDRLAALIAAARARDALVILDRSLAWCAYDPAHNVFDDAEFGSHVLTIGSFSTAYAMSGWRVGYFAAPRQLLGEMAELKVSMSICTSAISQHAALAALEGPPGWLEGRSADFARRRDLALALLNEAGIDALGADAWPALLLDTRLIHPNDRQAATMIARDAGVRVEPAARYGSAIDGYTRISLAASEAALRDGLQRIAAFHSACG
jgi:aspartate aminotransferase